MDEQQSHELGELVFAIRCFIADLNDKERLELFSRLASGYCVHCGGVMDTICRCTNDE